MARPVRVDEAIHLTWAGFDNHTGAPTPFGEAATSAAAKATSPVPLPQVKDAYVCIDIAAIEPSDSSWTPSRVYFRRGVEGWALVGLDRTRA